MHQIPAENLDRKGDGMARKSDSADQVTKVARILVLVGALNWGLVGLFKFDLVAKLLGGRDSALARLVYSAVGASAVAVAAADLTD